MYYVSTLVLSMETLKFKTRLLSLQLLATLCLIAMAFILKELAYESENKS